MIQRYYKRKIEKDKQIIEKREKESERQNLASVIGGVVKQSALLQPKTTTTTTGSKRNLSGKLEELESESKRTDARVKDATPVRCTM